MEKLHDGVKHFSLTISNRKKFDSVLWKHHFLTTNQLEQDHNCSRIVTAFKLLKSSLRTKRGTPFCYKKFNTPQFLAEDDWKTIIEFKAILRDKSRLTLVCQNKEKINGAYGPVMWKSLNDSLSRVAMRFINAE